MFFEKKHRFGYRFGGLLPLEINYTLVAMAMQMISSLGVVFVFLLGGDFARGIAMVVGYYGLQRLLVLGCAPLVGKLIAKVGYRWTTLSAMILASIKLGLLAFTTPERWYLLVPALVLGSWQLAAYEISVNGIFLTDKDENKIGEQSGLLEVAGNLGGFLAPLIGGLMVEWAGFEALFMLAMGLLLLASIPLFFAKHHARADFRFSWKESMMTLKREKALFGAVFWWHFQDVFHLLFWPAFLFLMLDDFGWLGVVGSLTMLAGAIANYYAGKIYDRRPLRRAHPLFSMMMSLTWIVMWFSNTSVLASSSQALRKLISPFWWMKIKRFALYRGDHLPTLTYGVLWEWTTSLAYGVGLIVGGGILWITGSWKWMLAPTLFGMFMSTWIIELADGRENGQS